MKRQNHSIKRAAILETICNSSEHPSAASVYKSLKNEYPDLSLGTVYRNIALFKEQELVIPVATVDGEERIDGKTFPHVHFVCRQCKRVIDICDFDPETFGDSLKQNGYRVDTVGVTFYGVCDKCGAKDDEQKFD